MIDRLTIQDCRPGFCVKGIRAMCETHGVDFKTFVKDGLPLEDAEKVDDLHVQRAVKAAKTRIAKQ